MLLNNFRRVLVNTIIDPLGISSTYYVGMSNEIKTTAGNLTTYDTSQYDSPKLDNGTTLGYISSALYNGTSTTPTNGSNLIKMYFACGDGDTPPTASDYKLSGNLITDLTVQIQQTTANNNSITFSIVVTNNTENPITIKEVGICLGYNYTPGQSYCAVLLTRDVLATPVTLNTGDSKTFSITIDFRSLTDTTVNE